MTDLDSIARIPAPGDNTAIAIRELPAGTRFTLNGQVHVLPTTVLEGHRFSLGKLMPGDPLLSWGLPFGVARCPVAVGDYLCNAEMLAALSIRSGMHELPAQPNFSEPELVHEFDLHDFRPGKQVGLHSDPGTFEGFARPGKRGTGTRNTVILLGVSSRAASFARALERRLKDRVSSFENIDGVVAVTHTEGGERSPANNSELVLRTLAGFMVHPNVAAVLSVEMTDDSQGNTALEHYMRSHDYPLDDVLHRFFTVSGELASSLAECEKSVLGWLPHVNRFERSEQPLKMLKIALQCGGSDAFSGVSGNPLAGCVAKELIRHGGSACLAETDELVGAEPYILANTRDLHTARAFLEKIRAFDERASWHGESVRGNPTGGNKFRGLYNIQLKSIGAARKKDPDVCLDYVNDYAQPMTAPGFYFMDSPGNDLESIAGQVAAGCNLIIFITGNGSITNFPFVPTIKFVTTSGRWNLLEHEMDVNAGRYQDGESMQNLSEETFRHAIGIASGQRSAGERARHSQVSIWRNWRQADGSRLEALQKRQKPSGKPVDISPQKPSSAQFRALPGKFGPAADQLGLIVPTSLCSGQIARQICNRLNASTTRSNSGISQFVSLVHTEGCGASSGENEDIYLRTLGAYLVHPLVKSALLLEHGCEHTHNDMFRAALQDQGLDPDGFGYASIQRDGGIEKVSDIVEQWFRDKLADERPQDRTAVGLQALSLGIAVRGPVSALASSTLAALAAVIVGSGGTVVLPSQCGPQDSPDFLRPLGLDKPPTASLGYGEKYRAQGLHVMEMPGDHMIEALSGMGATGVQLMLVYTPGPALQAHPMIPTLQVSGLMLDESLNENPVLTDLDHVIREIPGEGGGPVEALLELVCAAASADYRPKLSAAGYSDFQITRGFLGVSL